MFRMTTEILGRLFAEDDGTFHLTADGHYLRVSFDEGYQVGGYVPTLTNPSFATDLLDWIRKGRPELAGLNIPDSALAVGVWTDEDGNRHWDASTRWTFLPDARRAGARRGEEYLWDWAASDVVPVGDLTDECENCNGYGHTYTRPHLSIGGVMPPFKTPCLPCGGTGLITTEED